MKNIEREILENKAETLQELLGVDYFLQELLQSMSNQELRDALVFIDRNNDTDLFIEE